MHLRKSFGSAVIFCFALSVLPVSGQAPQDRGNRQQPSNGGNRQQPSNGGNRPGAGNNRPSPGGGNNGGNRPGPGAGNQGRPQPSRPQPSRPQPSRPQPSRPNPGAGRPQPGRPQPGRPQPGRPGRPPQWGHRPSHRPSYNFRPNDRLSLRRYYMSRFGAINRARRPVFVVGGFFPYGDIPYLSPLPMDLYGQLPPPPPGYMMGYYDGYVVVYDPLSYFIANVIDLLQ